MGNLNLVAKCLALVVAMVCVAVPSSARVKTRLVAVFSLTSAPELKDVAAAMTQSLTEQISQLEGFDARAMQQGDTSVRNAAAAIRAEIYVVGDVTKDGDEYFIHLRSFNVGTDLPMNAVMLATPDRSTPKSMFLASLFSAPPLQGAQLPVTPVAVAARSYPLLAPEAAFSQPQALVIARWDIQPNGEISDVHDIMVFRLPLATAGSTSAAPSYTRHIMMSAQRGFINGVAVDSKGSLYVCRSHEPSVGVDVYAPGESVDTVPLRHIPVQSPDQDHDCLDIAIDSSDKLYVLNHCCQVVVYPAGAGEDTQPIRRIIDRGAGHVAVDLVGNVYLLFPQRVDVFGGAANVARTFSLSLPKPHILLTSIAVGPDGQVYIGSGVSVDVYAPNASGNAEPVRRLDVEAGRIAVDSHSNMYVLGNDPTRRSTSQLSIFNAGAQGDAAASAIVKISGFADGIALWFGGR